jgi:hypothetical protein
MTEERLKELLLLQAPMWRAAPYRYTTSTPLAVKLFTRDAHSKSISARTSPRPVSAATRDGARWLSVTVTAN